MVEMKVCNKCGNIAGYNSWFGAVMCPSCNYIEKESKEFTNTLDKRDCTDEAIAAVRDYLFAEIEKGYGLEG